jgi:flavin reductase (DIM6/NTAB) family NADH-FMN oxidoreductase RutF
LVLFCIERKTSFLNHFADTTPFAINILHENQKELSSCFARSGLDRFAGVEWSAGLNGAPILPDVLASLECRVTQLVDAGDHVVVIGGVSHATWREGQPLVYFNSSYQTLWSEASAS